MVEGMDMSCIQMFQPFGSSTSVSFFAPKQGDVMIGVYDMLGNLVKELTNETYEAGMCHTH